MSLKDAIAKVRAMMEAQDLIKPDDRHYTREHQERHCTCWEPRRWICKEHNEEYTDCGCAPPSRV